MTLPEQFARAFPTRGAALNKYTVGTVTIVGGSHRFVHAPAISGLGARVAGAGLVHLVVPDASRIPAAVLVPEATFLKQTATCVPPKADVTALGMGLGVSPASEMLVSRLLSGSAGNFVLDADALNVLAKWYAGKAASLPSVPGQTLVLTPHAGEAARLLATTSENVEKDRPAALRQLVRRYNAVVVLKGPHTLVAAPGCEEPIVCGAGNPFMALGGMGDLLTGAIAARWAYLTHARPEASAVVNAREAAASAVWLHAVAADELVTAEVPDDLSVRTLARRMAVLRIRLERGACSW